MYCVIQLAHKYFLVKQNVRFIAYSSSRGVYSPAAISAHGTDPTIKKAASVGTHLQVRKGCRQSLGYTCRRMLQSVPRLCKCRHFDIGWGSKDLDT